MSKLEWGFALVSQPRRSSIQHHWQLKIEGFLQGLQWNCSHFPRTYIISSPSTQPNGFAIDACFRFQSSDESLNCLRAMNLGLRHRCQFSAFKETPSSCFRPATTESILPTRMQCTLHNTKDVSSILVTVLPRPRRKYTIFIKSTIGPDL